MQNNKEQSIIITDTQEKIRLDKFIAENLPNISRSFVKKLIEGGNITTDGIIILDPAKKIHGPGIVNITIPPPKPTDIQAKKIPLDIIFEDKDFLVINKQAGLTVHPGAGNYDDTMANALVAHCGNSLSGIGGVMRPGIVHRLDKDTSGLILAAKTDIAHNNLSSQIANRTAKRTYLTICWGVPKPLIGKIEANIGRNQKNRKKMAVVKHGGKIAITHYKVVKILCDGVASLVECNLETGRTHQIRVHFAYIGHPIIGDQNYTGRRRGSIKKLSETAQIALRNFKRQALHSYKLELKHPVTNKNMEFCSQLPEDFSMLLCSL